ncbi:hypothetical protein F2Q70_00020496 [Brassica cretica]|uniref:Uncharacterized protein n=1 Tax=Brassica cretica TaxID=69181 RepID=A0A8S9GLK6_BRACR|nr:hypothetical protein F2Q70_00020496 [Brassica cretica]
MGMKPAKFVRIENAYGIIDPDQEYLCVYDLIEREREREKWRNNERSSMKENGASKQRSILKAEKIFIQAKGENVNSLSYYRNTLRRPICRMVFPSLRGLRAMMSDLAVDGI